MKKVRGTAKSNDGAGKKGAGDWAMERVKILQ